MPLGWGVFGLLDESPALGSISGGVTQFCVREPISSFLCFEKAHMQSDRENSPHCRGRIEAFL